ncbi:uncharacterized protein LOC114522593 [Dendronephthya gigantea]|uniref:uncharacterized protein LOC114522593 n=1 Tax=Dendronephthya gigantea TaxID=151771 RepID=UPI00106A06BE|nr:uncharacterized protein LOC114522593 [Dendronephthya gigantea]
MSGSRSGKSILFEYCQKRKIGPPYFETWAAPNGYQAKAVIDGYPYPTSAVFSKKKEAEHDASRACLASLGIFEDETDSGGGYGEHGPDVVMGNQGYPGENQDYQDNQGCPVDQRYPSVPGQLGSSFSTPSPRGFGRPPRSGGPSGGNVKMPKSVLHEYCQSQKISQPQYETEANYDGCALLGFHCVLFVRDEYFTTDHLFSNKRDAEHAVAQKALNVFGYYTRSPLYMDSTPPPNPAGAPSYKTPESSYKNLLQEHLQQRSIETPSYETQLTDRGYISKVSIEGRVFKAKECCQTKKQAEQSAAKAGLIAMGVKDPEAVAMKLLRKNSHGRYKNAENVPYKKDLHDLEPEQTETDQVQGNTSWIHNHKQSEFDVDDYDDMDGEFTDFQKAAPVKLKRKLEESGEDDEFFGTPEQRPHKMQRVGEVSMSNSRPSSERRSRRRGEYEVEDVHLGNLSVGEAWPERRNIVLVGSEETSIPLFCQGNMERCALEDLSAGTLVDIVPGHRLVGLEGYYVIRGGQIVLRATQCQQILMPEKPDKVLISCGVVVLHCIPRRDGTETRCDVNVLLKRYLCSQAFINVVRGLAQYFRNMQADRPFILKTSLIIAHIKDWMLEEVMAISSFSETALENVFQHTMKFDKRWVRFLREDKMSKELREVQIAANKELFRRANSGEDQNQDRFRPWRLPKGNFYHRMLSTGVFIEGPAEAAMRELKEETGIKLKLSDISSSPFIDLAQADNINPHKGDFSRYYLCGIITEPESYEDEDPQETAAESQETSGMDSSTPIVKNPISCTDPGYQDSSLNYSGMNSAPVRMAPVLTDLGPTDPSPTGPSPVITNTTYDQAYSANVDACSGKPSSGYPGPGYANADAYSGYGNTSSNFPGTTNANTGSNATDTNSAYAYTAQEGGNPTDTGTSDTKSYTSGYTPTSSNYPAAYSAYGSSDCGAAGSAYSSSGSTFGSAYSAYTEAYSAYSTSSNTGSTSSGAYSTDQGVAPNTGVGSTSAGAYPANQGVASNTGGGSTSTGAHSTYTSNNDRNSTQPTLSGTSSTNSGTSDSRQPTSSTTYHGAYSAYTDAYLAYAAAKPSSTSTNSSFTSTNSSSTSTNSPSTNTSFPNTTNKTPIDPNPPPTRTESISKNTASAHVDTSDTSENKESNLVKNEREEETTVIRSPFVAGAVHEECRWFDMEEAREISTIFEEIYKSAEFQKLLAKLKGIVSAM